MGLINCSFVNTNPGSCLSNPFTPPQGFNGSGDDYITLCKERYRSDLSAKNWMAITASYAFASAAKRHSPNSIVGPYKNQVEYILSSLKR